MNVRRKRHFPVEVDGDDFSYQISIGKKKRKGMEYS